MNINAEKGDKVTVTKESINNGSELDKLFNAKFLEVGKVYTIDHTEVFNWHTDVYLQEIEDKVFNSVNFENVVKTSFNEHEMHLNMQYYMEHCEANGYCTPQVWIEKYKHFK